MAWGELSIVQLAERFASGERISQITDLPQSVILRPLSEMPSADSGNIILNSYEECLRDKRLQSANFKHVEQQSKPHACICHLAAAWR